jgi:hypothetical protein
LCFFFSAPGWNTNQKTRDRIAIEAAFGLSFSAIVIAKSP